MGDFGGMFLEGTRYAPFLCLLGVSWPVEMMTGAQGVLDRETTQRSEQSRKKEGLWGPDV